MSQSGVTDTDQIDLDKVDRQILKLLHENGRESYNAIGNTLDITGNTVRRRIDELQKKGIINGFTVMVNPVKLGYMVVAFGLNTEAGKTQHVVDELAKSEEVFTLRVLSGTHNVIFDSCFKSQQHFQQFIHDRLHTIEGITNYESSVMTKSVVNDGSTILLEDGDKLQ